MKSKRRIFVKNMGLLGLASWASPTFSFTLNPKAKLKILVLGGTNFLGPAIVNAFLKQGHDVTLFNRGMTNSHLFPQLRKIKGDREQGTNGYKNLLNENWDITIDVWPQNPKLVEESAQYLSGKTKRYMFISSIAVYNDYRKVGLDETYPLINATEFEEGDYSANKVLCERMVEKYFPDNFTILRPGSIVGDRDPGPFGVYLLNRMMNRSELMAPDSNDPVQFIDSNDIGSFLENCAANNITGHFNLVGPEKPIGYRDMLLKIKESMKTDTRIVWMSPEFLMNDVNMEPFSNIPFWIPVEGDPEPGFQQISNKKAIKSNLQFSDFAKTVKISYQSYELKRYIPEEESEAYFGIDEKLEDEIIAKWKKLNK